MKVSTKLYLSSISSIILVLIIGFGIILISNKINSENEKHELGHEVHKALSELNIITDEYLLYHEKRAEQQWYLKYDSTRKLITEAEKFRWEEQEEELVKMMCSGFDQFNNLFLRVVKNYEEKQKLSQEGDSKKEIDIITSLEKRLTAQLLINSRSLISHATKLAGGAHEEAIRGQALFNKLIVFLIFILLFALILTTFLVIRIISRSLSKLTKGAEIISKGNLKYKIDIKNKDEFGQLASVFNIMTSELKESYEGLEQKVKERTRELEEAKNQSEVLLASIGDGVFAIDRECNIIHFNKIAEELSGYKTSEVLGKPYYDVLKFVKEKDRSENLAFIRKALKGKIAAMADETVLIRKDGSELPVEDSASPIKDEKGKVVGVIVVFRDATKARKIQQMKSEFVSLVSHEIKTPLGIIKGYLSDLEDETSGPLTKKQRESVEVVTRVSNKLLKQAEELLNITRLEEGRVKTEPIAVNPIDLVEKAIGDELQGLFKQKKQEFTFKKPDGLLKIKVDPKFIITPIQNLLSNASKYTPEKGKIELEISQSKGRILFRVSDSGIGIPKEEQLRVFQRFFRASNATHIEKGTGLGLYISKLLIELSGGRVWFESEKNKGTTFYFTLPVFKS